MPCRVRGFPVAHLQRACRGAETRGAKVGGSKPRAPKPRAPKPRGANGGRPMTLSRGSSRALRLLLSLGLLALVLWLAHSRSVVGVLRQIESRWPAVVILLGIAECFAAHLSLADSTCGARRACRLPTTLRRAACRQFLRGHSRQIDGASTPCASPRSFVWGTRSRSWWPQPWSLLHWPAVSSKPIR